MTGKIGYPKILVICKPSVFSAIKTGKKQFQKRSKQFRKRFVITKALALALHCPSHKNVLLKSVSYWSVIQKRIVLPVMNSRSISKVLSIDIMMKDM